MSERGPEINISTEKVTKVVNLSREITRIKILDDRSGESNERARNFLKGNFNSQYESVEQMINLSRDPGRPEGDVSKKNAQESLNLLGSALLLAGQDKKIENWVTGAEVYEHLPSSFAGAEKILQENLLVNGKDDEIGKKIVEQLGALEKTNRRAAMAPNSYKETKEKETKRTIDTLLDVYEGVDPDSEDGLKIGAVVGCLDSGLSDVVETTVKVEGGAEVNKGGYGGIDDFEERIKERTESIIKDESLTDEQKKQQKMAVSISESRKLMTEGKKSKELGTVSFDNVLDLLDEIENSGRESTDLTINSKKFGSLYEVAIGNKRVVDLPQGLDIKEMILERIQLNDRALLASKARSVEDIVKTMSSIHEGDNDKSLDRNFFGYFLKKEVGGLLPIKEAWNLRQDAYFDYFNMDSKNRDKNRLSYGHGMLVDIVKKYPELIKGKMEIEDFLDVGVAMHESEKFGIYQDYYSNFRCEINPKRKEIVKEYMIQEIMRRKKYSDNVDENRKRAEKAYDLVAKLSIASYQDSAANINLVDGDDYAEFRLLKFLLYQDSVDTDGKKIPKNKAIGSYIVFRCINTLTPVFLETLNNKKNNELWKPLYADDIDTDKIDGKSDMSYHFGSIILKKVLPVKTMFIDEQQTKDVLSLSKLRKGYERLNKVVSESLGSGMEVLDLEANGMINMKGKNFMEIKQRKLRFWYVAAMMDLASETRFSEWDTEEEIKGLKELVTGKNFYGPTQEQDQSFISEEQWKWIDKSFNVVNIVRNRERSDARKKRAIYK